MLQLQDDIAHSKVQDSLMYSAGRTSICLYDQQMILYYKTLLLHCRAMMILLNIRLWKNAKKNRGWYMSRRLYYLLVWQNLQRERLSSPRSMLRYVIVNCYGWSDHGQIIQLTCYLCCLLELSGSKNFLFLKNI